MMQPEYAALFEHRFIEDDRPSGAHTLMVQYRTSFPAMDGRRELFREVLEITVDARSGVASRIKAVAKQVDEEGSTFERLSALKNGLEHEHPAGTVRLYPQPLGSWLRDNLEGAPELGGHSTYLLWQSERSVGLFRPEYGVYQAYDPQANRVHILRQPKIGMNLWEEDSIGPADVLCILT